MVLGVNLDDLADHRPGQDAAAERGAAFPLVTAGFTKAHVPCCSRRLGLRTWDKPAAPAWPRGCPTVAGDLRHPRLRGPGRVGAALPRVPPAPGPPLRRTARIEVPTVDLDEVVARREDGRARRCMPPATAT